MNISGITCPECSRNIEKERIIDGVFLEIDREKNTASYFFSDGAHIHCPNCGVMLGVTAEKNKLIIGTDF